MLARFLVDLRWIARELVPEPVEIDPLPTLN